MENKSQRHIHMEINGNNNKVVNVIFLHGHNWDKNMLYFLEEVEKLHPEIKITHALKKRRRSGK